MAQLSVELTTQRRRIYPALCSIAVGIAWAAAPFLSDSAIDRLTTWLARTVVNLGVKVLVR